MEGFLRRGDSLSSRSNGNPAVAAHELSQDSYPTLITQEMPETSLDPDAPGGGWMRPWMGSWHPVGIKEAGLENKTRKAEEY